MWLIKCVSLFQRYFHEGWWNWFRIKRYINKYVRIWYHIHYYMYGTIYMTMMPYDDYDTLYMTMVPYTWVIPYTWLWYIIHDYACIWKHSNHVISINVFYPWHSHKQRVHCFTFSNIILWSQSLSTYVSYFDNTVILHGDVSIIKCVRILRFMVWQPDSVVNTMWLIHFQAEHIWPCRQLNIVPYVQ